MNFKQEYNPFPTGQIRREDGKLYGARPQEKGLIKEFKKEGGRLGLFFNGMQGRINDQLPVALFTDNKTRSTFGVEPGQSVMSKLIETRKRFRFVNGKF
jgi:hypothetical protein